MPMINCSILSFDDDKPSSGRPGLAAAYGRRPDHSADHLVRFLAASR